VSGEYLGSKSYEREVAGNTFEGGDHLPYEVKCPPENNDGGT
jgi:hypothetical protein